MTSAPWNTSPVVEQMADTDLTLTDGLKNDSGVLKALGQSDSVNIDGFKDNFDGSVVDLNHFPTQAGASIENNMLKLAGGSDGYATGERTVMTDVRCELESQPWWGAYYTRVETRILINQANIISFRLHINVHNAEYNTGDFISFWCHPPSNTIDTRIYGNGKYVSVSRTFDVMPQSVIVKLLPYVNESLSVFKVMYSFDEGETFITSSFSPSNRSRFQFDSYYADPPLYIEYFNLMGYPTSETAELPTTDAYTALLPAKLAKVLTIQPHISTAGNGGIVDLHVQHKSDEDEVWKSLADTPNEWTNLGVVDGSAITVSDYLSRTNDNFRFKLVYSGTGLVSYPEIDYITWTWESDVTAPSEPVITTAIATSESILTILFNTIDTDAYAIEFELNINGAGSLPVSDRNKIESGHNYLRLVGSNTNKEKQGERNTLLYSVNGLQENDVIVITAYQVDKVGNRSAGKQKSITMSGAQYLTMLTKIISEQVSTTVVTDSVKEC